MKLQLISKLALIFSMLFVQIHSKAQNNCECSKCHVSCNAPPSAHTNTECPVVKNRGKAGKTTSNSISFEQQIAQHIIGTMISNMINNTSAKQQKVSEEAKQKKIREDKIKQERLNALLARQKKHNDSISKARHEKLLKEMKPLEGHNEVAFKPLENPMTKVNFNCKITGYKGQVKILKGDKIVELSPTQQSVDILPGDYIVTGNNSYVKLHYALEKGGEDVMLGQNSAIKIIEEEDGTHTPKYLRGNLYGTNNKVLEIASDAQEKLISEFEEMTAELRKKVLARGEMKFRIGTTCSIRGTEYHVSIDSIGNSQIYVMNGMVDVIDDVNSKYVTLTPGYMCTVNTEGEITGLFLYKMEEKDKWWLKE